MSNTIDGYVGDVSYAPRYHRACAPSWLHFVATALARRAPDPSQPYRWCELGCGPAYGAAVLAAANPHAVFHAIDANADHVRAGQAWVERADLRNLTVERATFAELAARANDHVAPFDYIVLTGVYAWVSPANQAAVRDFVRRYLKPGGIVHLAYPCLPGMAAMMPLRNLFRDYAASARGDASARAAHALVQVRALGHGGAAFFDAHPALLQGLDAADGHHLGDFAHDYLAQHWQPQHVGDVVRAFEEAGCHWVGSAQPAENIDAVCLPAAAVSQVQAIEQADLRESARAFCMNQALRNDIYQRTGPDQHLTPAAHRGALLAQRLFGVTTTSAHDRARRIVEDPTYGVLRGRLAQGALSFAQAAQYAHYASQPGALNPAFQLLAGAGIALPVLTQPPDPLPAQAFNRAVAQAVLQGALLDTLAAPALGAGVAATLPQMAALLALHDRPHASGDALIDHAWTMVRRHGAKDLPARHGQAFANALADIHSHVLPTWRQLGVLA